MGNCFIKSNVGFRAASGWLQRSVRPEWAHVSKAFSACPREDSGKFSNAIREGPQRRRMRAGKAENIEKAKSLCALSKLARCQSSPLRFQGISDLIPGPAAEADYDNNSHPANQGTGSSRRTIRPVWLRWIFAGSASCASARSNETELSHRWRRRALPSLHPS